ERLLFAQLEAAAVAAVAGAKADADLDRRTGRPVARELFREGARERAAGEHLAVAGDDRAAAGGRVQHQGSEQRSEDEACGELTVRVRHQSLLAVTHRRAPPLSSNISCNASRPRARRLVSVPIGTSMMCAASL